MKRPLFVIGGILLLSTAVSFLLSTRNSLLIAVALSLTALLLWVVWSKGSVLGIVVLLSFSMGLLLGARYVETYYAPFEEFYDTTVHISGFVKESTQTGGNQYRYLVDASFPQLPLPQTQFVLRDYSEEVFQVGELVQVTATLQKPKYQSTARYYRSQGISGEGVLAETLERTRETTKLSQRFYNNREFVRESIYKKNKEFLPEETGALVNGMVFGMTSDLPSALYSAMNAVGTSHLISVSGLHLSIVVGAVLWLLQSLGLKRKGQYLGGMVAALLFTLLVGASPPMIRSCIMSLVYLFGQLVQEESDSLTSLGLAAIVICVFYPYWIFSLGMWLSFLSTGGIIVCGVPLVEKLSRRYEKNPSLFSKLQRGTASVLGITCGAYTTTFPLLVLANGIVPLLSPLANLLVSPFSTVVVVGGVLLAIFPESFFLYKPMAWIVAFSGKMIIGVSYALAKLPFAGISLDHTFLVVLFLFCFLLLLAAFFLYKYKKKNFFKAACLGCVIILSLGKGISLWDMERKVEVILFEENDTVLLLQGKTGILLNPPNQYGMKNLLDYLQYRGIQEIDALYLLQSKGNPHSGLLELTENYPPTMIMAPDDPVVATMLSQAFPGVPIYKGAANVVESGRILIVTTPQGEMVIFQRKKGKEISLENYDIIEKSPLVHEEKILNITPEGVVEIPENTPENKLENTLENTPDNVQEKRPLLGYRIYGEKRLQ